MIFILYDSASSECVKCRSWDFISEIHHLSPWYWYMLIIILVDVLSKYRRFQRHESRFRNNKLFHRISYKDDSCHMSFYGIYKSDLVGKWKIARETIAIRVKNSSQREKGFQLLPGCSITASTLPEDDNPGLTTGRRVSIVYRVKAARERSSITFAMLHAVLLLRRDGLSNNLSRYLPSVISSQWSLFLSLCLILSLSFDPEIRRISLVNAIHCEKIVIKSSVLRPLPGKFENCRGRNCVRGTGERRTRKHYRKTSRLDLLDSLREIFL